jgi:hypothetical protein
MKLEPMGKSLALGLRFHYNLDGRSLPDEMGNDPRDPKDKYSNITGLDSKRLLEKWKKCALSANSDFFEKRC